MIKITTNKSQLDLNFIYNFLKNSYWANHRTLEQVKESIENSLCFGMYLDEKQIGFARVLTDKVAFSYIMDVFIDPEFQGKKYGQQFMDYIYNHADLKNVRMNTLLTKDAQEFYKKLGFVIFPTPEKFMYKLNESKND
ncbi:MAG: GNAT family N-acetyltransferase [Flavobacteriaceae bacterium]